MTVRLLHGDVRAVLPTLPDASVHCCVTSPPYWGLRSYLPEDHADKHLEIGSEPSLELWVATMVEVFREVKRVLRDDGTLWLNLGDAYVGSRRGPDTGGSLQGARANQEQSRVAQRRMTASARRDNEPVPRSDVAVPGLKPKDMMGQPWRVAFALQADGWFLRQEIIWHKPNPMPESARDRCTKAHEHVFLLSKSERYFYDFDAMQEPVSGNANARGPRTPAGWDTREGAHHDRVGRYPGNGVGFGHGFDKKTKPRAVGVNPKAATASGDDGAYADGKSERLGRGPGWRVKANDSFSEPISGAVVDTRNPRSVWSIPTHAFRGAHFATFPPALAERCITAGCPPPGDGARPVRRIRHGGPRG
jgi:DNA modification methylase